MKVLRKWYLMLLPLAIIGCANQNQPQSNMKSDMSNTQMTQSSSSMSDATITTKVKTEFMSQDLFTSKDVASMTIHVRTVNGIVYLTGTADNKAQIRHAISIAKKVDGVKRVVSKVRVKKS